jgi:5-methylcytosine-specific restriction endonuclease McrA
VLSTLTPRVARLDGKDAEASRSRYRDAKAEWRAWYKTARWQKLRWSVLVRDCFTCQLCGRLEGNTAQLVCDHIEPHRGDEARFWNGPFQTLCKPCHDGDKQASEKGGHAAKPEWLQPSAIPVVLVCGPAGAGKNAWVGRQALPGDVVIDLDVIVADLSGKPVTHDWDRERWLGPAMRQRNHLLGGLSRARKGRAWVIVTAPEPRDREWWRRKLGADRVVVFETSEAECETRAERQGRADPSATRAAARLWWRKYRPAVGEEVIQGGA